MARIALIARNTFAAILRNRLMVLVLLLLLLVSVPHCYATHEANDALDAGETDTARGYQVMAIGLLFSMWTFGSTVLGAFLGATALSGEIRTRTIVPVLSRPIERWAFVVGKWLGTQAFVVVFALIGMIFGLVAFIASPLALTPTTWIGMLQAILLLVAFTSLAFLLGTLVSPAIAGGLAFAAYWLHGAALYGIEHATGLVRILAELAWIALPARLPGSLLTHSLEAEATDPDYGLFAYMLGENAGYALAMLALACSVFTYREIRVRS